MQRWEERTRRTNKIMLAAVSCPSRSTRYLLVHYIKRRAQSSSTRTYVRANQAALADPHAKTVTTKDSSALLGRNTLSAAVVQVAAENITSSNALSFDARSFVKFSGKWIICSAAARIVFSNAQIVSVRAIGLNLDRAYARLSWYANFSSDLLLKVYFTAVL